MTNFSNIPAQQSIALAKQRLAGRQVPRGAQYGAVAGQAPQYPVPQGADQGNLAGCGDNTGCASGFMPSPFAGFPQGGQSTYVQPSALLGVFIVPTTTEPITIEIACGNTIFNACGARSFTPANSILLTSIISGFNSRDQLCDGSGIDVAYFNTNGNECFCAFDFGCFSNLAPLRMTIEPVDGSVLQPLNLTLVGDRLEFDGCFPFPPGMYPPVLPPGYPPPGYPPVAGAANYGIAAGAQANPWGGRR